MDNGNQVCPACGKPVLATDANCMDCGARLSLQTPAEPQEQELWEQPAEQVLREPLPLLSYRVTSDLGRMMHSTVMSLEVMGSICIVLAVLSFVGWLLVAMFAPVEEWRPWCAASAFAAPLPLIVVAVLARAIQTHIRLLWAILHADRGGA